MYLRCVFRRAAVGFPKFAGFDPVPDVRNRGVVGYPLDDCPSPDSDFRPRQLSEGGVVGVESGEASEPPTFSNRVKISFSCRSRPTRNDWQT